jgi:hypothetical protein
MLDFTFVYITKGPLCPVSSSPKVAPSIPQGAPRALAPQWDPERGLPFRLGAHLSGTATFVTYLRPECANSSWSANRLLLKA